MSKPRRVHSWWQPRTRLSALKLAKRFFEAVGTPKALAASLLLESKDYDQLVELEASPGDYRDPLSYFLDAQVVALLKKYDGFRHRNLQPQLQAEKKFLQAEEACRLTNSKIRLGSQVETLRNNPRLNRVLHAARGKIATILGPLPELADLSLRFGPGASVGVRKETSVLNKVTSVPEATFALGEQLDGLINTCPHLLPDGTEVTRHRGSHLTFVPKNAKTHRSICIEPTLNGLLQKSYGSYIRRRLLRYGVDLDTQSVSQELARRAYTDELSTVDFSSASDTIAYMLVLDLLPIDWFEALDVLRCPSFLVPKGGGDCGEDLWVDFHKFTSMGNAYTFELETLIFYALAYACCKEVDVDPVTGVNIMVYGDDVIIPRAAYLLFQEVTSLCGFTFNEEKSFSTGNFFESCGADWFMGYNVRPIYLKQAILDLEDMYYATNSIIRIIGRLENLPGGTDCSVVERLHQLHSWCVACLPRRFRILGPPGSGDGCLEASFDVAVPARHSCWDGYYYRHYSRPAKQKRIPEGFAPLVYALYYAGSNIPDWVTPAGWHRKLALPANVPRPPNNGRVYTVRGRLAKPKVLRSFWFGDWPEPDAVWSDTSIRLCERG